MRSQAAPQTAPLAASEAVNASASAPGGPLPAAALLRSAAPLGLGAAQVDELLAWPPADPDGPSGSSHHPNARSISLVSDEAPDFPEEASPEGAAALRKKSSRGKQSKPLIPPSGRLTRLGLQRQREEAAKSGLEKVSTTVRAVSLGALEQIPEADESYPDVFASFGEADLTRASVRMEIFDDAVGDSPEADLANAEFPHTVRDPLPSDVPSVVDTPDAPAAHHSSWNPEMTDNRPPMAASSTSMDDNQANSRSASILRPFNYFFGSRGDGAVPSTSSAATPAAPTEAVDSPLDDPLEIAPQTSSTPKE